MLGSGTALGTRQAELTGSVLDVITTWEWPNTYGVVLVVPDGYDPEADARAVLDDVSRPFAKTIPTSSSGRSWSGATRHPHWWKLPAVRIFSSSAAGATGSSRACCWAR